MIHDCPWVGDCHCIRDGSLCTCSHQHGSHGDAPVDYDGACTECSCPQFTKEKERMVENEGDIEYVMPELETARELVEGLTFPPRTRTA